MTRQEAWKARRGARAASWAVVLVVIVAIGIGGAFLLGRDAGGQQTTSTSTSTVSSGSTSTGSPPSLDGLQLTLTLNGSDISHGQGISATVEDVNTMATPLNITSMRDWPVGNLAIGPCGTLNLPIGFAVLQGKYDLSNVTSVTALQLYAPGPYACPAIFAGINGYIFQPSSDNATIYGSYSGGGALANETVLSTGAFNGYYSGGSFTSFPSGVYTVVAGDEWGDISTGVWQSELDESV